jgi:GR25 family glycosyltransferase involved in LPS biosynthesis
MSYAGVYINLDHKPERRAAMETELARYGLGGVYTRFRGTDGNADGFPNPHNLKNGVIGCFVSHGQALETNAGLDRHLHVVEDDAVFTSCTERAIRWAIETGKLDRCDILYTDISVPLRSDRYKLYRSMFEKAVTRDAAGNVISMNFDVFSLKNVVYASAVSYLVNRRSIGKLSRLLRAELERGPEYPIDLFYRKQSEDGTIVAGCLFPFVTSINFEHVLDSSVDVDLQRPTALARLLGRYCFFAGCDWDKCEEFLAKYLPRPSDRQARALEQLLGFSLTDAYRID